MYIYVHGSVTLPSGSFTLSSPGKVYIIADGAINIAGNYNFGNTNMRIFSHSSVNLGSDSNTIYGLVYAHNSSNSGVVTENSVSIDGGVIGDTVNLNRSGAVYSNPTDPLPGSGGGGGGGGSTTSATWNIASWELL